MVGVVTGCLALAIGVGAQVQTQTSTAVGQATQEVEVHSAEVVLVNGNDLVVKLPNGSLRHFPNVPESARAIVDGKELGIHDLKPGMILQRTIVTTSTPQTITTVKSVKGTVWYVSPPSSVILTLEDGKNQSFKIPKDQKFNVDGQMVDAWGLKKGMRVSATQVVEVPETLVTQKSKVTGTMPTPPPADVPILVAQLESPAPAAEEPARLPKTGSELPLISLIGIICMGSSFGLKWLRH